MSNKKCDLCAAGNHAECVWAAGLCPECGPTGCLGVTPTVDYGVWAAGPESYSEDDREQLIMDAALWGNAYLLNGKRVDPTEVIVYRRTLQGEVEQVTTAGQRYLAQEQHPSVRAAVEANGGHDTEVTVRVNAFGALNLTEWTAAMLADWQDATITSAELLTLLDEMLDRTLHSDACHIDPDDTTCFCVIGQLRSVLPPCPVKQPPPSGEGDLWSCTRKAHPASPDRHVWSNR